MGDNSRRHCRYTPHGQWRTTLLTVWSPVAIMFYENNMSLVRVLLCNIKSKHWYAHQRKEWVQVQQVHAGMRVNVFVCESKRLWVFCAYVKGGTNSSCLSQKGSYKKYKHIKDDFPLVLSWKSSLIWQPKTKCQNGQEVLRFSVCFLDTLTSIQLCWTCQRNTSLWSMNQNQT